MKFLHTEYSDLSPENVVRVTLDRQANVQLLDDINFSHYRKGERFKYYGGLAERSPFHLSPPYRGRWHLVIDLGGHRGSVNVTTAVM